MASTLYEKTNREAAAPDTRDKDGEGKTPIGKDCRQAGRAGPPKQIISSIR